VFVEGLAGQVFKDQALTVSISLIASLVVSPAHATSTIAIR
jgi:multidrug efflux pump subunit AcrB